MVHYKTRSVPKKKHNQIQKKNTTQSIELVVFFLQIGCVFFFSYGRMGTVVPYDRSVPYPHTIGPYLRTIGPYPPYRTPVPHRRTHSVPMYQVMVPHHRTHTVSFFQKPYLAPFLDLDKYTATSMTSITLVPIVFFTNWGFLKGSPKTKGFNTKMI